MKDFRTSTAEYEVWLNAQTPLLEEDIATRHEKMKADPFSFLRATFYRWVELMEVNCNDELSAPQVLAVGDLHIENFGTWRDLEGRLIWGINDFDDVCQLPYTNDLVRLATSALLAIEHQELFLSSEEACEVILSGYAESIEKGGAPFVLAERHPTLYKMALSQQRNPVKYWEKLNKLLDFEGPIPSSIRTLLESALPEKNLFYRIVHRQAGLGSLGRARYTALATWGGSFIAREAKCLLPSSAHWRNAANHSPKKCYDQLIQHAVRVRDPFLSVAETPDGTWVLRRLAPDCSRIEVPDLDDETTEKKILYAMGWETANLHLATKTARGLILSDLKKRKPLWLLHAAETMAKATEQDWNEWQTL
jgi:hypothetical protein